ncbi:MAG: S46 family peptidase [Deltaproteobacteria bacterium]|nr:S46 family peptidase [Deltaproteobacteria bacterium]
MGSGIPAKLDDGGRIVATRGLRDYFHATTDSFGGNSGSGVFNADGEVLGILVRGEPDYEISGSCYVVSELPEAVNSAEGVTQVQRAVDDLCASGWPSERLCLTSAECGDGQCTGNESVTTCPADCIAECGNGLCESDEFATCPQDCGAPPASWTCQSDYYGANDGCDCECGAFDPDCDDVSQELYNCSANQVCGSEATCEDWTCNPV